MSGAPAVAPGLLIAERYRLEALVPDRSGRAAPGRSASRVGQLWHAHDEVLARSVAVLLVEDDDPLAGQVLAGARAVAGLTSPALAKVYDAGQSPGVAFVVTEYFDGGSLDQQLLGGPLEPTAAVDMVADICEAIDAAHRVGLYGLTPAPGRVLYTASGLPRLAGVALADEPGTHNEQDAAELRAAAERNDTVALAYLLYATLTSRWPGDPAISGLPPAPYAEGHLRTPRQVRGGVPREIDAVVAQALGDDQLRRGLPEIATPRAFADALEPLRSLPDDGHPYGADTAPIPLIDARSRRTRRAAPSWLPARRGTRLGLATGIVVFGVAIAGLFTGGPTIYPHFATHTPGNSTPSATHTAAGGTPVSALSPRSVAEFDPYGDHTDPHVSEAPRAMDGNPATAWHTQTFRGSPDLGKTKPGVGLIVDFGTARQVSAVHLRLLGDGTTVELLASNGASPPASDKEMTQVAAASDAGPDVVLRPSTPTSARFWLVWLTKLPHGSGGFAGGIAEMTFQS